MSINFYQEDQRKFMLAMDQEVVTVGRQPSKASFLLARKLIAEEFIELAGVLANIERQYERYPESSDPASIDQYAEMLREAVDLVYVIMQLCNTMGLDFDAGWQEIQRANMAKRGPDGKVLKNEDGKVMTPEDWQPPNMVQVILDTVSEYKQR